jgi:hypothetical protein
MEKAHKLNNSDKFCLLSATNAWDDQVQFRHTPAERGILYRNTFAFKIQKNFCP